MTLPVQSPRLRRKTPLLQQGRGEWSQRGLRAPFRQPWRSGAVTAALGPLVALAAGKSPPASKVGALWLLGASAVLCFQVCRFHEHFELTGLRGCRQQSLALHSPRGQDAHAGQPRGAVACCSRHLQSRPLLLLPQNVLLEAPGCCCSDAVKGP